MATYIPFTNVNFQFTDLSGNPYASGTLNFKISGGSTPTNVFSDSSGTILGTSITLNSSGRAPTPFFRDTAIDYKYLLKNAAGTTVDTFDEIKSGFATLLSINDTRAGTEGSPVITLGNGTTNDPDTGFYHSANNEFSFSAAGTRAWRAGTFGFDVTIAGTAGAPSRIFAGDVDTGWYQSAANKWAFAASGVNVVTFGSTVIFNDINVSKLNLLDYGEKVNIIGGTGGGTQDIDLELGNVVSLTVDTSTNTFTFSNPSATAIACGITIWVTNGGSQTIVWPASVDWPSATAPTLTAAGVDKVVFETINNGTLWTGDLINLDYS